MECKLDLSPFLGSQIYLIVLCPSFRKKRLLFSTQRLPL